MRGVPPVGWEGFRSVSSRFRGNGIIAVPLGLEAVLVDFSRICLGVEGAFWELDAPVGRVCSSEVPIPYPHHLEEAALRQPAAIVAAAKATLGG